MFNFHNTCSNSYSTSYIAAYVEFSSILDFQTQIWSTDLAHWHTVASLIIKYLIHLFTYGGPFVKALFRHFCTNFACILANCLYLQSTLAKSAI